MIHPDMANVKREAIAESLAKKFGSSADRVSIYGLKTRFGGGRSSGFALIYDSTDARKAYDTKTNLRRVSTHPP